MTENKQQGKKTNKRLPQWMTVGIMLVMGVVFFFFLGEGGPVICKDSSTYLEYTDFNGVMPLYPLVISALRAVFGEQHYLYAIFIVQGLLALAASMALSILVQRWFSLPHAATVLVFALTLLPYAYSLPEDVVSHEIMTESLAFTLFYLFFILLFAAVKKEKLSLWFWAVLPLGALVLTRSHLLFLGLAYGAVLIYLCVKQGIFNNKKILWSVIAFCFALLAVLAVVFGVRSRIARENEEKASQLLNAFFGKAVYVLEEEDCRYFEDEKMQEICRRLYDSANERGQLLVYAQKGLLRWEDIIVGQNENMKTGNDVIYQYYIDHEPYLSYEEKLAQVEIDKTELVKTIMRYKAGDMLYMYLCLLPSGLLSMVFIQKRSIYLLCSLYGLCFYLVYFVLLWQCRRRGLKNQRLFALLAMGISLTNVLCTNIVLYGMQRYMVYTFGLLYIAAFLMLYGLWNVTCKKRRSSV